MSLEKKLGNRRSLGFKIGTAAIAGLMGIMSYVGCRGAPVEYKPAEEVVETVVEEEKPEEIVEVDPLEQRINLLTEQHPGAISKIENINDKTYKDAILANDYVIEAIDFFDKYEHADILINKKTKLNDYLELYSILNDKSKEVIVDYIENITDTRNEKAIAIIMTSNAADYYAGFSDHIAKKFDMDTLLIINYEDNLIRNEEYWSDLSISKEFSSTIEEIEEAKENGDSEDIKINVTKKEFYNYLGEAFANYDTVILIPTLHTSGDNLSIYHPDGNYYIGSGEFSSFINNHAENKIFKFAPNICNKDFVENIYLKDSIDNTLLTNKNITNADSVLAAVNLASADLCPTFKKLENISNGIGSLENKEKDGRVLGLFHDGKYFLWLDYNGKYDLDFIIKSNTNDLSLFYKSFDFSK
jgi:hypothetical protein